MRRLLFVLLLLVASVYLGIHVMDHPGYLMIVYQPWMVQMPLWFACLAALLLLMIFYWLVTSFDWVYFCWFRFKNWMQLRREKRLYSKTQQGLAYLIESQWSKAEYLLKKGAAEAREPLVNFLGAAKAAHEQKAYDRRDQYFRLAHQAAPEAAIAIGITQAELEFAQDNMQRAAAILQHIRQKSPRHSGVLRLLERVYVHTNDWERLQGLLPDLRKAKLIDRKQQQLFEKNTACQMLLAANEREIHAVWSQLPRHLHKQAEVVCAYVERLQALPGVVIDQEVARLIRKTLSHEWSESLVSVYARLPVEDINRELVLFGAWLKQYGQHAILLLSLGKLCVQAQLWGKARDYFEKCLALGPNTQASLAYGRLLEQLGEKDAALEQFQLGLKNCY